MASKLLILVLLFMAIVASTSASAPAPNAAAPSDDHIGDYGGDDGMAPSGDAVVEAPVGGPVSPGAFANTNVDSPGEGKKSGAPEVKASAVALGAAAVAAGFFI